MFEKFCPHFCGFFPNRPRAAPAGGFCKKSLENVPYPLDK